jgi:hypothetical protein
MIEKKFKFNYNLYNDEINKIKDDLTLENFIKCMFKSYGAENKYNLKLSLFVFITDRKYCMDNYSIDNIRVKALDVMIYYLCYKLNSTDDNLRNGMLKSWEDFKNLNIRIIDL